MHPEHAELSQLRRELVGREARLLKPLADVRKDLVGDEGANGVADVALLV